MKTIIALSILVSARLCLFDYNVSRDQKEIRLTGFDPSTRNQLVEFLNQKYKLNTNPLMDKTVRLYFEGWLSVALAKA